MISDWSRGYKVVDQSRSEFSNWKPFSRFLAIAISRGLKSTRAAWTFFRRSLKEINLETQAQPTFLSQNKNLQSADNNLVRFWSVNFGLNQRVAQLHSMKPPHVQAAIVEEITKTISQLFIRCFAFLSVCGSAGKKTVCEIIWRLLGLESSTHDAHFTPASNGLKNYHSAFRLTVQPSIHRN